MSDAVLQHAQRKSGLHAAPSFTPIRSRTLQRKCACGGTPGPTGECAEIEKNKDSLGLGLSAIGKAESEPKAGGGRQINLEIGGELKGEGKFHPGGGPVFIYVEGSVKYTTKSEGGGKLEPGSLTITTAGGVGVQF
jgi:hypothetical protein